jgi:hypothetical protein
MSAQMGQSEQDIMAQEQQARFAKYLAAAAALPQGEDDSPCLAQSVAAKTNTNVVSDVVDSPSQLGNQAELLKSPDPEPPALGSVSSIEKEESTPLAAEQLRVLTTSEDILAALTGYDEDDSALQRSRLVGQSWAVKAHKLVTSVPGDDSSNTSASEGEDEGDDDDDSLSATTGEASHTQTSDADEEEGTTDDELVSLQRARYAKYIAAASLLPECLDEPSPVPAEQSAVAKTAVVPPAEDDENEMENEPAQLIAEKSVVCNDMPGATTGPNEENEIAQQRAYEASPTTDADEITAFSTPPSIPQERREPSLPERKVFARSVTWFGHGWNIRPSLTKPCFITCKHH